MISRIHRIVTGHDTQKAFAKEFLNCGVVAIGWGDIGDISKMNKTEIEEAIKKGDFNQKPEYIKRVLFNFRDNIDIGDPVIAYKSPNTVVAVGRIVSDYYYDNSDNLGASNGLNYPNKRKVKWIEKPQMFDRKYLPKEVSIFVSLQQTFRTLEYDFSLIEKSLSKVHY